MYGAGTGLLTGGQATSPRLTRPLDFVRSLRRGSARRNLALTVGAGLAIQLALAITGPLLARLLGPAGRGDLAALMLWPAVLVQVGALGIPATITYYLSGRSSPLETIKTGLRFAASQAVLLTLLQVLIIFVVFADRGPEVREASLLTLVAIPGILAREYGLAILQARSSLATFSVLSFLPVGLFATAVVVLFLLSAGLVPVVLSWVAANTLVGSIALGYAIRQTWRSRSRAPTEGAPSGRTMISFGFRSILGANSTTDIIRPEQLALALFLPARALGLYVVGLAFTQLPYFVAKAIGQVAFPAVARESDAHLARRTAWRYIWMITGVASIVVLLLLVSVSTLLPLFFGEDFRDAVKLTHILLLGALFNSMRRVLAECLRGRGQPGPGTVAELAAMVWLLIALAVLIPTVGLTGVAIALTTSQLASFALLASIGIMRGELRLGEATAALRS